MNPPVVVSDPSGNHRRPSNARREEDRLRYVAYLAIAAAAMIMGLALGQLNRLTLSESRIAWPSPDSIRAHPRSLQP
jgi:hypothetical protein